MRRSCLLAFPLAAVLVGGCASHPAAPPVTVALPPPAPPAAPVVVPPPPVEVALPRESAALGGLDLAGLDARPLASVLAGPLLALSELADVDPADYAVLLRSVGIDMRRPLVFAVAGLSAEQRRAIESLRALVPRGPVSTVPAPAGTYGKVADAMAPLSTSLAVRVLVPTLDAARLRAAIGRALAHGWHAEAPGDYSRDGGRVYVSTSGEGDTLVVDVALGRDAKRGIAGLRAQVAAGHALPVALAGRISALHFTPSALAGLAFLWGLGKTDEALSGNAVDPDQKDRIATQGLWEAGESFTLAGNEKGSFFDSIDVGATLDAGHLGLLARAVPGPAFVGPPDALWSLTSSVAPVREGAVLDLSQPFGRAWPLPGDRAGGLQASSFFDMVRDAGSTAWPIVLFDAAPAASRGLAHDLVKAFPSPESFDRFERIGAVALGNHDMGYGLLPEKTSRAAAECVLAARGCPADVRLTVGKTRELTVDGTRRLFRLNAVDKRFVVLMGTDREMLDEKFVTAPGVGPAAFAISGEPLARAVGELGLPITHVAGSIERRGSDIVMQVTSR